MKLIVKKLLVILVCIYASVSFAETYKIALLGVTTHLHGNAENEIHPMLQLEYDNKYVIGVFKNSNNKSSIHIAKRLFYNDYFLDLGVTSGYTNGFSKSVRLGYSLNNNVDLILLPGFSSPTSWRLEKPVGVIGVIFKY